MERVFTEQNYALLFLNENYRYIEELLQTTVLVNLANQKDTTLHYQLTLRILNAANITQNLRCELSRRVSTLLKGLIRRQNNKGNQSQKLNIKTTLKTTRMLANRKL